jgi:type VI secretion system secreted protein VgrG
VAGSLGIAVARSIAIEAGDQLLLKVGSASMIMKKSGEITITGSVINIKGSGDVVIKGSRILQN